MAIIESAKVLTCSVALTISANGFALIHGEDDRVPLYEGNDRKTLNRNLGPDPATASALRAVGGITCKDGTKSTAFLIDVSEFMKPGRDDLIVIATVSHAFYNESGGTRGRCWFHREEWEFFAISQIRVGGRRTADVDGRDWAFALLAGQTSLGTSLETDFRLRIEFEDEYDFDRSTIADEEFLTASFMSKRGIVGVASLCRPDDKSIYPWFRENHHDWSKMIIHDCDFARAGSGGPLLRQTSLGAVVIGVNVGEADPAKRFTEDIAGVTFNPPHTFNYARRFDTGLRHQLLHFLEDSAGADALAVHP